MKIKITSILFLAIIATLPQAFAQTTVTTQPVGFVTGTCKANSDTIVSVPLSLAPEYVGALAGAPTLTGSFANIVASGTTPGWTTNQFAALYTASPSYPTYYVKFTSGTLNGKFFTVTANDASSITIDPSGDTVTGAAAGDTFSVIKYWTLATLFPPTTTGTQTIVPSASTRANQRMTILGLPNVTGTGINLAANQWFYIVGTSWVDTVSAADASNQVLYPDTYFIVRNTPGKVTSDTTFTFTGSVNLDRATLPLATLSSGKQDNYVVLQRPVAVTLAQSGLASGFVASGGTRSNLWKDLLLVFDNTATGINKSPTQTFIMIGTSWYDTSGNNQDSFLLQPGTGFVIRKYTASGSTAFWANDPNY